jgi:predicted RNA-binding Zn-ribbon protein involved in translation (DUF1610 family)
MSGPDTPPEVPEPGDVDFPDTVLKEAHSVTFVCPECNELIRIRDVHAYVLSNHLAVCREMTLLTGERD